MLICRIKALVHLPYIQHSAASTASSLTCFKVFLTVLLIVFCVSSVCLLSDIGFGPDRDELVSDVLSVSKLPFLPPVLLYVILILRQKHMFLWYCCDYWFTRSTS